MSAAPDSAGRTAILEMTLDAMDQGISLFDADLRVVFFNRRFLEILDFPRDWFQCGDSFAKFIRFNAERGEYGPGDVDQLVADRIALARRFEPHHFERTRPDGTIIEIRGWPISGGGGFLTTYTDVTKHRRAERALEQTEARLRAAIESVSAGIGLFDAEDRLTLCNSHYKEHYPGIADVIQPGMTFEAILRTAALRGIVAESAGRTEAWIAERLVRHRQPDRPFVQRQSDGRWIQVTEHKTEDGGTVAVFADVTELKEHEQELAAANRTKDALLAEFNAVMDTIEYGILFLGPDLRARVINRAWAEMWGFPRDWVNRRVTFRELMEEVRARGLHGIPEAEFQAYAQQRIAAIRQGDVAPMDMNLTDGRVLQYQCKALADGGRMLTYLDVTESRRIERALRESEQRFKDFATASSDWFWEMDAELRFTFRSEPLEMATKAPSSGVLGKTRLEVGGGSIEDETWRRHQEDLEAHRPFRNFRYPLLTDEGEEIWVSTSGIPVFAEDGSFCGYRGTASNITAEVSNERELRAAKDQAERALAELQKAQTSLVHAEKLALLGQLVAGIAHEIKNPLNFVTNFAALSDELLDDLKTILSGTLDRLDGDQRAEVDELFATLSGNLAKIREHGARADGIVRSMLAHSREGPGEKRSVQVNALVEEALGLAYHGARALDQSFNVTLERDFDPAAGAIEVIPQDLSRVLLNLFANGFHATHERRQRGGDGRYAPTVTASTRRVDGAVEIRVRDNGTGIPQDVVAKIFTPFFTTKPAGEGTGLGLSLSYDIVVHQHGGRLEVDTREGEYTEFLIRLPQTAAGKATLEARG